MIFGLKGQKLCRESSNLKSTRISRLGENRLGLDGAEALAQSVI